MDQPPAELGLGGLDALAAQLGRSPAQVADSLHGELHRAFAQLDGALSAGDLAGAKRAGHAARNSALMLEARPMLAGLRAVDEALGHRDLAGARAARARLDAHWLAVDAALRAHR